MQNRFKYFVAILMVIVLVSCVGSEASIQKYYVDNQDNKNFLSVDIPASIISLKDNVDPEAEMAYNSLKKLNVLAFKKNGANEAEYETERKKVKSILKDKRYTELMRVKDKGKNFIVKYEGDENTDSFDEVVVFASDKVNGFALVRVLGNDMTPEKFMKLADGIKDIDVDNSDFKELNNFLKQSGDIYFNDKK